MANQYIGTFPQYIKSNFNQTAESYLNNRATEGLCIVQVADQLGMSHSVVRKYAKKYQINFLTQSEANYQPINVIKKKTNQRISEYLKRKWVSLEFNNGN